MAVAAGEVRRYRAMRGMSAQQLADRCTELGVPIKRSVLANFESGRRPIVSVPELMVFAEALGVPPIRLLFPLGYQDEVEVLPGKSLDTWEALKSFVEEGPSDADDAPEPVVLLFRQHDELMDRWQREARAYVDALAAIVYAAVDDGQDEVRNQIADMHDRRLNDISQTLRDLRASMRRGGLIPPRLPDGFGVFDDGDTP